MYEILPRRENLPLVLEGFRELAGLTTELPERGVLLRRLVEDVVRRLSAFGYVTARIRFGNEPRAHMHPQTILAA
jgi:hypothetical protein